MRIFPEIRSVEAGETLTLETGPALIEHFPFVLGFVGVFPVWLYIMWGFVTGEPFPNGPFVPVTFSTGFVAFSIYFFLAAPTSVRAVIRQSAENVEITTKTLLGEKTRKITPQPGQTGLVIDRSRARLAVLGPGRWNRKVFLTGPFKRPADLADFQVKVRDWLAAPRRPT